MNEAQLYSDHLRTVCARTDAALAACGFESLAIHSGRAALQFLDDQPYPFKVNPHFKAWVPLTDAPDCWITYRPGARPRLIFVQPQDFWHKPPALPSGDWTAHFEIEVIEQPDQAKPLLAGLPRCAFVGEWRAQFETWGFAEPNPQALLEHLHWPRAAKTPYELACLRQATAKGVRGHLAARDAFQAGASEFEIHLAYLRASGHTDEELPYPNIVALGANAAVLHYQHREQAAPAARTSFLIDAGAQHAGYACDITRTYAATSGEFGALIEAMEQVQQALCAQVRSGVDYARIHLDAHLRIAQVLSEAGIVSLTPADTVDTGLSQVFFPHGVGHLLGLQVHDVSGFAIAPDGTRKPPPEGHPWLRLTRTLEPGFVVTIEPGLYFIAPLLEQARAKHGRHIDWQCVERLRPYGGIRIEDNVVCTDGEPENLTRAAFAAAAE